MHTTGTLTLGLALLIFGLANGAVDVSMNDQAVIVERGYGRPIMSAFHAFWSVGGAVGCADRRRRPRVSATRSASPC